VGAEGAVAEDRPPVPGVTVVVQPRQSLWAIAIEAAPGSDPRETVARIRDLNGLDARPVRAGQQLVLPAA
jgi:LysM repeat protein